MKAVGARDAQVMTLFLLEGALVGLLGAGVGLLLAWLGSFPGDRLAAHLIEKQTPMRLDGSVYEFTAWALAVVPLGVTLWTTLAAVSPARRAARIDPIEALRSR
jgi:ABC-type lipoprotein release transport system permease subunit